MLVQPGPPACAGTAPSARRTSTRAEIEARFISFRSYGAPSLVEPGIPPEVWGDRSTLEIPRVRSKRAGQVIWSTPRGGRDGRRRADAGVRAHGRAAVR